MIQQETDILAREVHNYLKKTGCDTNLY
jgi:hypothetical protein